MQPKAENSDNRKLVCRRGLGGFRRALCIGELRLGALPGHVAPDPCPDPTGGGVQRRLQLLDACSGLHSPDILLHKHGSARSATLVAGVLRLSPPPAYLRLNVRRALLFLSLVSVKGPTVKGRLVMPALGRAQSKARVVERLIAQPSRIRQWGRRLGGRRVLEDVERC
eukprot:scaffold34022_cov124-Isochrysis_galbana.AAC.1